MKNIQFIPDNDNVKQIFGVPKPAKRVIPDWYLKTEKFYQTEDKMSGLNLLDANATNTTMRACMPFLDSLTAGYVWELPVDLEFRKSETDVHVRWRFGNDKFISVHHKDQFPKMPAPVPSEYDYVYKFKFEYVIKTPKGYSTLFTHPLNRHDLPFRTFSGIVDTDSYDLSVQFPFQIHANFGEHLIVPRGTPVIQFIPFKRENWKHEVLEHDSVQFEKSRYRFFSKIQNSYKTQYWQKKSFS